jgi:hypothetical protein
MSAAIRAPLMALAMSIGLIATYLAFGGATYDPAEVASPCEARDSALTVERDLFEGIALSSLDGAACDLGVSREELALALANEEATADFAELHDIDSDAVNDAVRAGLERAVDDAAAAGRIDGIEEAVLRAVAQNAPVGPAIDALRALPGEDSTQALLEQLGGLGELSDDVPALEDLPGYDEIDGLIP